MSDNNENILPKSDQEKSMSPNTGSYTCHYCTESATCPFAFDSYNVNGDCLMDK